MNSFNVSTPAKTASAAIRATQVNPVPRLQAVEAGEFRALDASELHIVGGGDVAVSIR
jgi:hypothetical protein